MASTARASPERKDDVMSIVGITNRRTQRASTLSGGWQQRLALACALIHEPGIIFLDEPTAGIDPVARRYLWDLLFELSSRGTTLFVTTHYMDEAERCTDVGYIYLSKLIALGKPSDLKMLPDVNPEDTVRFEIVPDNPTLALRIARSLPGVRSSTFFGESIHLLVDRSLTGAALSDALTRQGVRRRARERDGRDARGRVRDAHRAAGGAQPCLGACGRLPGRSSSTCGAIRSRSSSR